MASTIDVPERMASDAGPTSVMETDDVPGRTLSADPPPRLKRTDTQFIHVPKKPRRKPKQVEIVPDGKATLVIHACQESESERILNLKNLNKAAVETISAMAQQMAALVKDNETLKLDVQSLNISDGSRSLDEYKAEIESLKEENQRLQAENEVLKLQINRLVP